MVLRQGLNKFDNLNIAVNNPTKILYDNAYHITLTPSKIKPLHSL
jgi:hypothetical protein